MSEFDVSNDKGLEKLEKHLLTRSFIGGYVPTKSDIAVFSKFSSAPAEKYVNSLRWYNHISSYKNEEKGKWGEEKKEEEKKEEKKVEEDIDLFGDEEETEEAKQEREKSAKELEEKKKALASTSKEGKKKKKRKLQNPPFFSQLNLGKLRLIWLYLSKKFVKFRWMDF